MEEVIVREEMLEPGSFYLLFKNYFIYLFI